MLLTYALTMVPEPLRVLELAWATVRPGGLLAVADFTEDPVAQSGVHRALARRIFALDGVRPDGRHAGWCAALEGAVVLGHAVRSGTFPFFPSFVSHPYYAMVLRKTAG